MDTPDAINAEFAALRELRREMREIGSGERQPTQFRIESDGAFTRVRVIAGSKAAEGSGGEPR